MRCTVIGRLMMRGSVCVLVVAAMSCANAAAADAADAPKPFISPVVELPQYQSEMVHVPTAGKYEPAEVYYDVPFAVHLPVEVPYNEGMVSIYYDVSIRWDVPEKEMLKLPEWRTYANGVYRIDGKKIEGGALWWAYSESVREYWQQMWYCELGPKPVYLNQVRPPQCATERGRGVLLNNVTLKPRKPFRRDDDVQSMNDPFVFEKAEPGWYALWFSLTPWITTADNRSIKEDWPVDFRDKDELKVLVRFNYIVCQGKPELAIAKDVVDYLMKRGKKPKEMAVESKFRVGSSEMTFTVKRNGWEIQRVEVEEDSSMSNKLHSTLATAPKDERYIFDSKFAVQSTHRDAKLKYTSDMYERTTDESGKPVVKRSTTYQESCDWYIQFPTLLKDAGVGDVTVAGTARLTSGGEVQAPPVPGWRSVPDLTGDRAVFSRMHYAIELMVGPDITQEEFERTWSGRFGKSELRQLWVAQKDEIPKEGKALVFRYYVEEHNLQNEKLRRLFLFADSGTHCLMGFRCGPWDVYAYYSRVKDVVGRKTTGTEGAPDVEPIPDDGYWAWLLAFNQLRAQTESNTTQIRNQLVNLDRSWKQAQRELLEVAALDNKLFPPMPASRPGMIGGAVDFVEPLINRGENIAISSVASPEVIKYLQQKRKDAVARAASYRQQQEPLIQKALLMNEDLVKNAREQYKKSKDTHPQVLQTVEHWMEQGAILKMRLYDAAGRYDPAGLPQVLAEGRIRSDASEDLAQYLRCKLLVMEAAMRETRLQMLLSGPSPVSGSDPVFAEVLNVRMQAIAELRAYLKKNPDHAEAKMELAGQELILLNRLAAKVESAKQTGMLEFQKYLSARGYNPTNSADWWEGVKEFTRVWWGSGPTALGAGVRWPWQGESTADANADMAGMVQEDAAVNQISIMVLRRLVRCGYPLNRIRIMSRAEFGEAMNLTTCGGAKLGEARTGQLHKDVFGSINGMADLQALMEGNAEKFAAVFGKDYYQSIQADRTWCEAISDTLFSPTSLLLCMGPSAVGKINGKWVYDPRVKVGVMDKATTMREVVFQAPMVEGASAWMAESGPGKALIEAIKTDRRFFAENQMGWFTRAANSGARFSAAITLYLSAGELAEESGIPGARTLVDAIAALSAEEYVYDLIARSPTPAAKIIVAVESYEKVVVAEADDLMKVGQNVKRIEECTAKSSSLPITVTAPSPAITVPYSSSTVRNLNKVDIADLESITKSRQPAGGGFMPPGTTITDDVDQGIDAAARALRAGHPEEAGRAVKTIKELTKDAEDIVKREAEKCKKAKAVLRNAKPPVPEPSVQKVVESLGGTKASPFVPAGGYPTDPHWQLIKAGDQALRNGDRKAAEEFYREAGGVARRGNGTKKAIEFADERFKLASDAESFEAILSNNRRNIPEENIAEMAARADDVSKAVQQSRAELGDSLGSARPVHYIYKKGRRNEADIVGVFKQLKGLDEELETELMVRAAAGQIEGLGLKIPACEKIRIPGKIVDVPHRTRVRNAKGEIEEIETIVQEEAEGLLFRYVKGSEMQRLPEAMIVANKKDLGAEFVLRLWLGDSDGHMRNIWITSGSRTVPIDFGLAHLKRDATAHRQFHPELLVNKPIGAELTSEEFMRAVVKWPAEKKDHALYGWVNRKQQMLGYQDMKPTIDAIKDLCSEGNRHKLEEALMKSGASRDAAEEAYKTLIDRAKCLDKVLEDYAKTLSYHRAVPRWRVPALLSSPERLAA